MAFSLHRLRSREPRFKDFTPTLGQTEFILDDEPEDPNDVVMLVNQVAYTAPAFIGCVGNTVTWNNAFQLAPTDVVRVLYFFLG